MLNPKFVILMVLGQRPRLPQPLYSQLYLTLILNRGGILVWANGLDNFLALLKKLQSDNLVVPKGGLQTIICRLT